MSDLQFDRAVSSHPPSSTDGPAVTCAACQTAVTDSYYDVNGHTVCSACRTAAEAAAETPRGVGPLAIAAACGCVAAVAGALIYYAVLALANLEIGIVAILIGYMVGYSVRKGARGGGRRFQILAVVLTYAAVALAYTPIIIRGVIDAQNKSRNEQRAGAVDGSNQPNEQASTPVKSVAGIVGALVLFGFAAALPVLVIFNSFPSGLISAFIIFIGLRQAWKMTAAPHVHVLGPYRVGSATTSA
jgi:hypothetical protein